MDTIPDPDHPAVNVTVGQPDFFRMYVSGQSWGRSQPVDNVAGGEIFAILDANAHWIKTYADAQYCRWDYFGHVETFVHKLVVPPSLQNKRNLQADVASFNAMAAEHENEVIANIQSIWSPAVLINRTDGDGQDILDREYARRTREFSEKWSPDSQDEFRFVIAAKLLIQKIMQDAGLVGQLNLQYWENIANSHD